MSWLSDTQICIMYRDSKDRKEQIKILSELTLYSVDRIASILRANGYEVEMPKRCKIDVPPQKSGRRWSVEEYLKVLQMYGDGASIRRIAKECYRTESAIKTALRGLQERPGCLTTDDMRTALRLYEREAAV